MVKYPALVVALGFALAAFVLLAAVQTSIDANIAKRVPERLKRFAASARYERELFDPETLEMGPRPQGARPQPAAAAAAATSPLAPAASREALR